MAGCEVTLQLINPKFKLMHGSDIIMPDTFSGGIYPACKGLSSDQIKKVIKGVLGKDFENMNPGTPVRNIAGIGPVKAKLFNGLGVHDLEDLLEYFPRDWDLPIDITDIDKLEIGKRAMIVGEITSAEYVYYGRVPRMEIVIDDGLGECQVMWFNGGYLRYQLKVGKMIILTGKIEVARR